MLTLKLKKCARLTRSFPPLALASRDARKRRCRDDERLMLSGAAGTHNATQQQAQAFYFHRFDAHFRSSLAALDLLSGFLPNQ